jgi:hypothetical protein
MVLIMIITWYLYGKKHYIGPIRALTKWSAGVEINPLDPHNFKTSVGRRNAIFEYMKGVMSVASDNSYTYAKTGETSGSSWTTSIKKWTKFSALFSKPASETVFVDDGAGEGVNAQTTQALPESGLLPQTHVGTVAPTMAALDESVLLPGPRVSFDSSIAHTESEVGTTTTFGRTSVGQTDTFGAPTQHRARGPVAPRARVHRDHRAAASVTDTMPAIDESQLDPTATRDYDLFPSNSRW